MITTARDDRRSEDHVGAAGQAKRDAENDVTVHLRRTVSSPVPCGAEPTEDESLTTTGAEQLVTCEPCRRITGLLILALVVGLGACASDPVEPPAILLGCVDSGSIFTNLPLCKSPIVVTGTVDRIEGDLAVIETVCTRTNNLPCVFLDVPLRLLPSGLREGAKLGGAQ